MRAFEYTSPRSAAEAVEMLAAPGAVALAGGTDLLSLMKDGAVAPSRLVNLKAAPELGGMGMTDGGMRIGATTPIGALLEDDGIRSALPAVTAAIAGVGSPQLLAMGTVGGDLLQRPRCWYFRAGFGLAPMEGGESLVRRGDNRYHAILGNDGPAAFVNCSSLAPPLIALGATISVMGAAGAREMPLEDLYRVPASSDESEFSLAPGEIATGVTVPSPAGRNATYEVRTRRGLDWPLASASVALGDAPRIVLGHVAPTPWMARAAAGRVRGGVTEGSAGEAADAAVADATPLSRNGYKVQLARVAVRRALLLAGMEG